MLSKYKSILVRAGTPMVIISLLCGCLVPVVPARRAPEGAYSEVWAEADDDALAVLAYSPKRSGSNGRDIADAIMLVGGLMLGLALVEKNPEIKVPGQVIWNDGRPCSSCYVSLNLTNGEDAIWTDDKACNTNGYFTIVVEGSKSQWWIADYYVREYVGDVVYPRVIQHTYRDNKDVIIVISE